MFISQYIVIPLYIFSLLLGAAVTMLTAVFAVKQKSVLNSHLRVFTIAFLFYEIGGLFIYYFVDRSVNADFFMIIFHFSNICYFIFVLYWIKILGLFSCNTKIIKPEIMTMIIIIYGLAAESLGTIVSTYDLKSHSAVINEGVLQTSLGALNFVFCSFVLLIALRYAFYSIKRMENGRERALTLVFSVVLMLYMLWTVVWDYNFIFGEELNLLDEYAPDPLILLYNAQSITVIFYFLKKDPLELSKPAIVLQEALIVKPEEQMALIAERFTLTEREGEVMALVYDGLSNPEIGNHLFIAENTVKRHLNNIFRKTGTKTRYELLSLISKRK